MELVRGKKLLKQIFQDHWPEFVKKHPHIRPSIHLNVQKMLLCGTEENGFHLYKCPSCGKERKVPHTCKSRFCSSCGVAQTDQWIERYTTMFANCQYQHLVFHPPSEFRAYFAIGRNPYFNALYAAVNQTLKDWYQSKGYLPGVMSTSHSFGRDLKFTPHIHTLITCGGLDVTKQKWINCLYIPHQFLKERFKYHFVKNIKHVWINQRLEKVPKKLRYLFGQSYQKSLIYKLLTVTWYVHVGKRLSNAIFTVSYIGRYTKRPAISESRIKSYTGQFVTFVFRDHANNQHVVKTIPALEFIGKLVRHIPNQHFRIIRYSGLYANRIRSDLLPKVFSLFNQNWEKAKDRLGSISSWWREKIKRLTKVDPLICPSCSVPLMLTLIAHPPRDKPLW